MYNRDQIAEEFAGLIGVRPSYDSGNTAVQIDDDLQDSESGQFINDLHELFTLENFANCVQNFPTFSLMAWNSTASYRKGAVVQESGNIFQAIIQNSNTPVSDTGTWRKTTLLSVWFRDKYTAAILQLIDKLIEAKRAGQYGKQLQGNTPLYIGEGVKANTIEKKGRFVGYRINVAERDLAATLQRLSLQITEGASLPMYLFYSGQTNYVHKWIANNSSPGRFTHQDVTGVSLNTSEGYYVVGYYEEDLPPTARAIRLINQVFYTGGCGSCNQSDRSQRAAWGRYIGVVPVAVKNYGTKEQMTFSLEDMEEHPDLNWGLNLAFSFGCDMSDLFIREKRSFTQSLAAQLRVVLMEALSMSVRNNQQGDQVSVAAYNTLYNFEDPYNPKIALNRAIKNLDFEFSGINKICAACNKANRIKYNVVG